MNKRNKSLIAILLVLTVGLVGLTIAYFANSASVDNIFTTQPYGTTVTENFTSPSNWLPGQEVDKTVVATNTGNVDEAVRISLSESWTTANNGTLNGWITSTGTKSSHLPENEPSNDERVAIINFDNTSDWTYSNGYYYYNYKLAPNESTSSLIKSVTFNPKTKLDDTCITTEGNGTKTITCNSSGEDYDNATYTLTFTVETVQYDKYAEAWQLPQNTTVAIGGSKPQGVNFAQHIMSKSNAATVTNYTDGVTTEAYTFNHEATEQTPALTDYRYIGASPNNYVEFNCDDNGENCEIWRAIGVFYVDDGNNNWEWRVKLVRESALPNEMKWDSGNNDWTVDSINTYLNDEYYNDTLNGLKNSSHNYIVNTKYYLGAISADSGSTDELYSWERGNQLCVSCESNELKKEWKGNIALMYPSDQYMTYSKGIDDVCYNDPFNCSQKTVGPSSQDRDNPGYPEKSWIYNSNLVGVNDDVWFLTTKHVPYPAFQILLANRVGILSWGSNVLHKVRPTLYLSSSVKITDGTGEQNNPYKLGL